MNPNANNPIINVTGSQDCSVCRDLLIHMSRFFEMLDNLKGSMNQWLTVEEVADELKLSKSIVYRIIRNGDLEAVNLVETGSKIAQKGHYRIKRKSLDFYLEQKKVKSPHQKPSRSYRPSLLPKVKNHLGL